MLEEAGELVGHPPQSVAEAAKAFQEAVNMNQPEEQHVEPPEDQPVENTAVSPSRAAEMEAAHKGVFKAGGATEQSRSTSEALVPDELVNTESLAPVLDERNEVPTEIGRPNLTLLQGGLEENHEEQISDKPRRQLARKFFSWVGRMFGLRREEQSAPEEPLTDDVVLPDNVVPLHSGGASETSETDQQAAP